MKSNNDKQVNFEVQLERLEELCDILRLPDTKLAEASKCFEEGMQLSMSLEKELAAIEAKVERLMKGQATDTSEITSHEQPTESYLELFNKEHIAEEDD